MKVYQAQGKKPLEEIEHLQALLGALYQGHQAYVPEHTAEDTTIVLHPRSQGMADWWQQVQAILEKDGYEVEKWG